MRMKRSRVQAFSLIELMVTVAIVGVLAALALPQYQTYVFKSHVQRVVGEAGALKVAVELCLASGRVKVGEAATAGNCDPQATGSNLQATSGNAAPAIAATWATTGSGVPEVSLSPKDSSTIVVTFGNLAGPALKTGPGTITWTRSIEGEWTCNSANFDSKYASTACPL